MAKSNYISIRMKLQNLISRISIPLFKKQPFVTEYSEENTCVGVSFNKIPGFQAYNFIKKRLQQKCFLLNIAKFLKTVFLIEHLWWLLLSFTSTFRDFYREELLDILFPLTHPSKRLNIMPKADNRKSRSKREICLKLTIKTSRKIS